MMRAVHATTSTRDKDTLDRQQTTINTLVTPIIDKDTRYDRLGTYCYSGEFPLRANLAFRISSNVCPDCCKRYSSWATSVAVPRCVARLSHLTVGVHRKFMTSSH